MIIGNREIGPGHPVFIVAELSGNHGGSFDRALQLVHAAHQAGADAIKTQCFTPDTITIQSDAEPFRIIWQGQERTLYDLYCETAMPREWHSKLMLAANSLGMEYFASVFSSEDADFMESLSVPAYKIASFELTDLPLIRHVARKGKPVILSTGMATEREIGAAQEALAKAIGRTANHILLQCTSAYPASLGDANLLAMQEMQPRWAWWDVGLSDHTLSIVPAIVAVSLGACLIEKHFTLSRANGGPDADFSLEPHEFALMVKAVRDTEQALGEVRYGPTEAEKPMLRYRRSLFAIKDIELGEVFTIENIRCIRPADGLPPEAIDEVLGKVSTQDIERGTPLDWSMVG